MKMELFLRDIGRVVMDVNNKNKINIIKRKKEIIMAKIKQIGGDPKEIAHNAKDVLIWLNCLENKSHPAYMTTPYDFTQNNKRCPVCEGREPIATYVIRYYVGKKVKECQNIKFKVIKGAVTTLDEAKSEVIYIFNHTIKKQCNNVIAENLVIFKDIAPTCHCGCGMVATDGNVEIVGRMEGIFDKGEFIIDIVKV